MRRIHFFSRLSWISVGAAVLAAAGLTMLFCWDEYRNWSAHKTRSEAALQQAADGVMREFDSTVQLARMSLSDIVSEYRDEITSPQRGAKLRKMMLKQLASAPQLEMVSAFDANGKLIAISANSPPSDVDFSREDYFLRHQSSRDPTPYIALPQKSRLDGKWVLTISQRLDDSKGNFGGVVVASFTMNYFQEFFDSYALGANAAFAVARADGILLAQGPYDEKAIGKGISADRRFPGQFGETGNGVLYYTSMADNQQRVGAFRQSAQTGAIVLTTATVASVFAQWVHDEFYRWFTLFAVIGLTGLAIYSGIVQSRRRLESEQKIAAREAEFRLLAESSVDLIQRLDMDGKRLYVSPASHTLFGIDPNELVGQNFSEGLDKVNARSVMAALARLKAGSDIENVVVTRTLADGRTAWVETTFRQVNDGKGTSVVAVSRDVTALKLQHSELEELAKTDALTGLANRRAFDVTSSLMVEEAARRKKPLSALMIDVDCFKKYNDFYGHSAGDECLKAVAAAIKNTLRLRSDHAFRYGGEEFVVLLTGTDLKRALACAERVRTAVESLALPHAEHLPGKIVTVSIGTATLRPKEELPDVLKRADAALYMAKSNGRNRVEAAFVEELLSTG